MIDRSFKVAGKNGKGVLLVHGLTGAPGEMKFVAKRLVRRGFAVSAPTLAGHGQDEKALLRTTWRDWLDSIRPAYEKLAAEVDEVFVAGICVGGSLGLMLAADTPKIAGAAVYSIAFEYDGWNMPRIMRWAPLIQLVANAPLVRDMSFVEPYPYGLKDERLREMVQKAIESVIAGALDRMPMGSLYEMYRLGRHLERVAPRIQTPTLALHARQDDMCHPRNSWRLAAALGGHAEVKLLEDSYHMIHVDRERDQVAEMTAEFFVGATEAAATRALNHA